MWEDVRCEKMWDVRRCQMWEDVRCEKMSNVRRCQMWEDVRRCQMREVVRRCQMWEVVRRYHMWEDLSYVDLFTPPSFWKTLRSDALGNNKNPKKQKTKKPKFSALRVSAFFVVVGKSLVFWFCDCCLGNYMAPPPKIGIGILNLEFRRMATSLLRKKMVLPEINWYRHLESWIQVQGN